MPRLKISTLTQKRVTLPAEFRDYLDIVDGDPLLLSCSNHKEYGNVVIIKKCKEDKLLKLMGGE